MKHFLQLVDVCRNFGVVHSPNDGQIPEIQAPDDTFWQKVEICQPFVFSNGPMITDEQWQEADQNGGMCDVPDAPFEVFSVEYQTGPFGSFETPQGPVDVFCGLAIEVRPQYFTFLSLMRGRRREDERYFVVSSILDGWFVNRILGRMSTEEMGLEHTRQKIKIGSGKNKRLHRLRRIIHIRPKSETRTIVQTHRQIDWTHRFQVRGHWRKVQGLGKDREGQYCVDGFTWVKDFTKGPEDLPMVKKVRYVTSSDDRSP